MSSETVRSFPLQDTLDFCRLYYQSTFFPISCYGTDGHCVCSYPELPDALHLADGFLPHLLHAELNPCYYVSQSFSYLGAVRAEASDLVFVLGPILSTRVTAATIHRYMHEGKIAAAHTESVTRFFHQSPLLSFSQFLHVISYLHFCLNRKTIDTYAHFGMDRANCIDTISPQELQSRASSKEIQEYHNTWYFERQYLSLIESGDPDRLRELLLSSGQHAQAGAVADNALRQEKNIFIASATLATRSAIQGGLDIETAYQLSDTYILEAEKTSVLSELHKLQLAMTLDFAQRVQSVRLPARISRDVFDCIQYVKRHTNEPIRIDDAAAAIGRSRSYISSHFREEMGISLNAFIMRCKLEEAKSLLTYTDRPLSDIAGYLCFSSQSYFQNMFKKEYGMTPTQYRNQAIIKI